MIPKVIHYCWFGGAEKPASVKRCIKNWQKVCPDYEIREWTEKDFDVRINDYCREAYDAKVWGFVPDFIRLWIIYNHGGIYLDTDVELLKPIDDFLEKDAWFGYMRSTNPDGTTFTEINTGSGFGSVAGNPFLKKLLDQYLSFDSHQPFQICNRVDTAIFIQEWPNFQYNATVRQEYNNMVIIDDIWRYTFHYCVNSWLPWHKRAKNKIKSYLKSKRY